LVHSGCPGIPTHFQPGSSRTPPGPEPPLATVTKPRCSLCLNVIVRLISDRPMCFLVACAPYQGLCPAKRGIHNASGQEGLLPSPLGSNHKARPDTHQAALKKPCSNLRDLYLATCELTSGFAKFSKLAAHAEAVRPATAPLVIRTLCDHSHWNLYRYPSLPSPACPHSTSLNLRCEV
jgi:hypothetical protein